MDNLDFLNTIYVKRCKIILSESESFYLKNLFRNRLLNESKQMKQIDFVVKIVKEFYDKSKIRYFREEDIQEVSNYFFKKLNENRGRQSSKASLHTSSDLGNINSDTVLDFHTDVNVEHVADTFSETDEVVFYDDNGEVITKRTVTSPDEAHVAMKQIEVSAISKSKK